MSTFAVSLVDDFNLPMRIDNSAGCGLPLCGVDLCPNRPTPLKGPYDSTGFPVGCKSACAASLAPDPKNSLNCCRKLQHRWNLSVIGRPALFLLQIEMLEYIHMLRMARRFSRALR
ncbi:hypothetical protein H4582DRAFT_509140 [Lactarius indigo]|nr:hypothetical protein H4582DRAFT_509140 [Lactarius indigo]